MNIIENSAEKQILSYSDLMRENGLNISGIVKKQFNFEISVLKNNEVVKVQTYFGKKGVKTIIQGDKDLSLYKTVNKLIFGEQLLIAPAGEFNEPENYIGTDESGKGDYFGPLVIAGVLVNPENIKKLHEIGVKDSKELSDNRIGFLAREIKKIVLDGHSIVVINPEKYNELYTKFKNVNKLLAWGHARVIENILEKIPAPEAISDKFGDENLIKNVLQTKGKGIILHQFPRAEKYTAVAAASILARDRFNYWFTEAAKTLKVDIPKGASSQVEKAAIKIRKELGNEVLNKCVKLHFKTTNKINIVN